MDIAESMRGLPLLLLVLLLSTLTACSDAEMMGLLCEKPDDWKMKIFCVIAGPGDKEDAGTCQYDSDCAPICEENVAWKRGCDRSHRCVKTFETDCAAGQTAVGKLSFSNTCAEGVCVKDVVVMQEKRDALRSRYNDLTAGMQGLTTARLQASKNCLSGLSDVTSKLIVDTGLSFGSLPKKALDVLGDQTQNLINELATKAIEKDEPLSAEEFISLNCNLLKVIDQDAKRLDKERQIILEQSKALDAAIKDS
jgi:hypothetical protein